jgi:glycosyltransferase involved in cell wall biosynthesis
MKLLIVSSGDFYSDYGGGQIYVKSIVDSFIDYGVDMAVVSLSDRDGIINKYRECPVLSLDINNQDVINKLSAILDIVKPDIVHAHGLKSIVSRVCYEKKIPCIITVHHAGVLCPAGALMNQHDEICKIHAGIDVCLPCVLNNVRYGKYAYLLLKYINKRQLVKFGEVIEKIQFIPFITPVLEAAADIEKKISEWHDICNYTKLLIAPSNAIATSMVLNGAELKKISVLPHGIIKHTENIEVIRHNNDDIVRFFFIGRINYIKGLHVLLKAFSEIEVRRPVQLHIIGSAGTRSEHRYMHKMQKKYINDYRIKWHGKINNEDIGRLISMYDVLVHPTICLEVYGLNIAEALLNHKPVIATRCGGPEDQIRNGENGILIEPNNVTALHDAMISLSDNPQLLQTMSSNTSKTVVSIIDHVNELINIYRQQILS